MASTSTPWGDKKVVEETAEEWVTLQTKTFTRWCNSHLRTRNLEIADLFTDVSDGTILLNLLEIIGKDTILATCGRKFTPPAKCKMEIHKLENCNLIFEYLKARELKIVNIGSSDIKDGSPRLVLGLLWTIILRFAIDEDGKEGLLLWCRKNTKEKNPEVEINNFSRSWQDGLGFAALLNKFRPDLINYNDMLARKDDPMFVMNAAFDAAEQAGIPKLLDAEDIVNSAKPDDKSIIAYLSLWFAKFAALAQKDALADAIKKAIAVTRHHDSLIAKYGADSESLIAWTRVQTQKFTTDAELNVSSTAEVKSLIEESHTFKNTAKPEKQGHLAQSEALLANLRMSQRNNERPLHSPSIEVDDLETEWSNLEKAEQALETESFKLLDAFEHTDYAMQRFGNKIEKVDAFVALNAPVFAANDYGTSVETCHALLKKCSNFKSQAPRYTTMMTSCGTFLDMCHEKHAGTAAAKEWYGKTGKALEELNASCDAFEEHVKEKLAEEERLLALKEKYEFDLSNFEFTLWEFEETLKEPVSMCNTVAAVIQVIARTEETKAGLEGAEAELVEIEATRVALESAKYPFDRKTAEAREMYDSLKDSLTSRFASLQAAHASQQSKQKVKEDFAAATTRLMEFCGETTRLVMSLTKRMSIAPEMQAEKLNGLNDTFNADGPAVLAAVESAHDSQVSSEIWVNSLTTATVFSCRLIYAECEKGLKDAIEVNAAHVLAQSGQAALSAEQAKEIRETFDTLDTDKSGRLVIKEFQDGLQGMGLVMTDDASAAEFKKRDLDGSDSLSFEEFAAFILEQFQSGSSESDIVQAFNGLSDGQEVIGKDTIGQWFGGDEEVVTYMGEKMPSGEYTPFVAELFKV